MTFIDKVHGSMDPKHWRQIEEIYYSILDAPAGERNTLLEQTCRGDEELRREVESLLQSDDDASGFLSPEQLREEIARMGNVAIPTAVGDKLGDYEILGVLGAGAMGEVYRARDTRLARQVALKVLPAHFTSDAARVARFRQEARAASALNHPNIVAIYEIGQAGGAWFIAAELIEGITLRERLAAGPLPVGEALGICLQCAAALEAAHSTRIVHRDIKPENIMVRADGVVKLVDFGLARISEPGQENTPQATQTGSIMGTPRYMSPEQARGQKLDARTDLFSLGAVFYEMITGSPAFPGRTTAEVFAALLNADPPALGGRIGTIIARSLQKDPAARYQSIEELAHELRSVGGKTVAPARFLRRSGLRRRAVAGVALVLPLAAVVAWLGRQHLAPGDAPVSLVPLTSFPGAKDFASFSPDGTHIAFSWNGGKEAVLPRHIYVKAIKAGDPIQLTSDSKDDFLPAWSPDGQTIVFNRTLNGSEAAVITVPSSGGPERQVAIAGLGVSWSPDGKWLSLAHIPQRNRPSGLYLLSLETGERRELTGRQDCTDAYPAYSPDGHWIAFTRKQAGLDIFIMPASGGTAKQLTFDSGPKLPGITWTADSREVVYSTEREYGGEGLWRVSISGGKPRRISGALEFAGNPNISRRGDHLAYTESWIDSNIYRSDGPGFSKSGVPGPFGPARKIIASSREDHSPSFSPDGERIAFVTNRTGHSEIWTARSDGGDPVQLTHFESFTGTPRWSPDGKWIVFDCLLNGISDIWVSPAGGGAPRRLTTDRSQHSEPSWSADGTWIYYNAATSGTNEVWKIKPDGTEAMRITSHGAREAMSPDGRTLYYTKRPGGSSIWTVSSDGGLEQPLAGMEPFQKIGRAWGVLPEGIYFVSAEQRESIRFFSFSSRRVTPLMKWPESAIWTTPAVALSADGKHLLTVQVDQQFNDLMMIENFH